MKSLLITILFSGFAFAQNKLTFSFLENTNLVFQGEGLVFSDVSEDESYSAFFTSYDKSESLDDYLSHYDEKTKGQVRKLLEGKPELTETYLRAYQNFKKLKATILIKRGEETFIICDRNGGAQPKYHVFLIAEDPIKFKFYEQEKGDGIPALINIMNSLRMTPTVAK